MPYEIHRNHKDRIFCKFLGNTQWSPVQRGKHHLNWKYRAWKVSIIFLTYQNHGNPLSIDHSQSRIQEDRNHNFCCNLSIKQQVLLYIRKLWLSSGIYRPDRFIYQWRPILGNPQLYNSSHNKSSNQHWYHLNERFPFWNESRRKS